MHTFFLLYRLVVLAGDCFTFFFSFFPLSVLHMTTPLDKQSAHSYGLNSRHYGLSWFTSSAFALLCGISRFLGRVDPPNPIISPRSFWISIHLPRSHFRITCLTRASSVQSVVSLIRPYYNPCPISSHLCHVFFSLEGFIDLTYTLHPFFPRLRILLLL